MSAHRHLVPSEHAIACALIVRAVRAGCAVSVFDGEEFALKRSTDILAILDAMASTDSDRLNFHDAATGAPVGSVILVYGNGADVIADESSQMESLGWYAPVSSLCSVLSDAESVA